MKDRIVIATRQSELALWQANFIADRLRELHPGLEVKLLGMSTRGDRWLSSPLSEVGGKGLFVKELEEAIADGRADIAVHSMKDVPAVLPDPFTLAAIGYRDDVRDALVGPGVRSLDDLAHGARVGSSSLRRQAMLRARRSDLDVRPVRGNVGTRLRKLDEGEYDVLVLAAAGLKRLGLEGRIGMLMPLDVSLPAAGQGALGIECRRDDEALCALLATLTDHQVQRCVSAERAVSSGLGADCSAPLGAHAVIEADRIHLRAVLGTPDGSRLLLAQARGTDPLATGAEVVRQLEAQGASALLAGVNAARPGR
ncbi:MAG: hydroxymethylbilane synthase [Gammaproteobacteria bacterium]|nr:hydroxymethylbilane synthase [Gammaproteobacteria bacterium]